MDVLETIKKYFENDGFIVTEGLKYEVDFLIYTDVPSKVHSKYALLLINKNHTFLHLISVQRVCASANKELILAILKGDKIEYFTVDRFLSTKTNI